MADISKIKIGTTDYTIKDTNALHGVASSSNLGGIKLGFAQSGKNYPIVVNSSNQAYVNVPWSDTTYESKAAASGGTAVSLCTTGEKYTWNNKANAFSVTDNNPTLAWSTKSKVATIAGVDINVTMPANPGGGSGIVKYQSSSGTNITVNSMSVGEMTYVYMSASGAKRLRMPSGGSYFVIDMTGVSVYNDYGSEIGFRLLQSRGRLTGNSYTEYRSWDLALVVRVG